MEKERYYRITNRWTRQRREVRAPSAQEACESLGWRIGECYCEGPRERPFETGREGTSREGKERCR